ncbi:MAG: hypothetical protein IMZ58_01230 [Thermoplasmata archaeon]|nr:hypothetical protein [Thermoplasmata archaeon]
MSNIKKEIEEKENELMNLLREKVDRLKAKRKTIRVRGNLRPNDGSMDSETGKPIKDDSDE